MTQVAQKRDMGKEDIAFDTDGTGETFNTIDANLNNLETSKLNDSHIPLLEALRADVGGAVEVNAALTYLANAINSIEAATTNTAGVVALATQAEVLALLNSSKAITPAALSALVASATQRGIQRNATTEEAEAQQLNNVTITPFTLAALSKGMPIGGVIAVPVGTVPDGYLECDGALFSAATYPDLNVYLGSTTLPDYRGEFLRGWDNGKGTDIGRAIGTAQAEDLEPHDHIGGIYNRNYDSTTFIYGQANAGSHGNEGIAMDASSTSGQAITSTTGTTETRPRNISVMYCIKY